MSSFIRCVAAIAGSKYVVGKKTKMNSTSPPPPSIANILVNYAYELRKTCSSAGEEKFYRKAFTLIEKKRERVNETKLKFIFSSLYTLCFSSFQKSEIFSKRSTWVICFLSKLLFIHFKTKIFLRKL